MSSSPFPFPPALFPVFFIVIWFTVVCVLAWISGWYGLMERYPDRSEAETLRLRFLSGAVGLVAARNLLRVGVCTSGLRFGIFRLFGPFSRDFFVPWEEISVVRRKSLWIWPLAELRFGLPVAGSISVEAHVADRLARAAAGKWPEPGSFAPETKRAIAITTGKQWAAYTFVAAGFFFGASRLLGAEGLPPAVCILFPAVALGIASVIYYLRRAGHRGE
jgi:hypothetical protein